MKLSNCITTKAFYNGLVEGRYGADLGANMNVDGDYLTHLFKMTFGQPPEVTNLTVLSESTARLKKLYRHGSRNTIPICTKCGQSGKTTFMHHVRPVVLC